jgi:pilus assembly protein FimV
MAIRTKLLEVYAKRRDIKGFELLATQVHSLTQGEGEDWAKAQEMGQQIDPDNALYQPGGQPEPVQGAGGQQVVEPLGATTQPHTATPPPPVFTPDPTWPTLAACRPGPGPRPGQRTAAVAMETRGRCRPRPTSRSNRRSTSSRRTLLDEASTQPAAMMATPPPADDGGIDFDLDSLSMEETAPRPCRCRVPSG